MRNLLLIALASVVIGSSVSYEPKPISSTVADAARDPFAERHPGVSSVLQHGRSAYRSVAGEGHLPPVTYSLGQ